jgi:O-antigen ligase
MMTEAVRREPSTFGLSLVLSAWHDPFARILNVDLLTVLIAILLPWSTTGVVAGGMILGTRRSDGFKSNA